MKTIEIRRYSMRMLSGEHLSQQGVTLARLLGQNLGPFDRVLTSTKPRAFETAIAMGFAVDEQNELMSTHGPCHRPGMLESFGKVKQQPDMQMNWRNSIVSSRNILQMDELLW